MGLDRDRQAQTGIDIHIYYQPIMLPGYGHFRRFSVYVSAVTLWEIAILISLGRVAADERLLEVADGYELLPVRPDHCKALIALPRRHRDPFDRMLIAQARCENLTLLTRDQAIIGYGPQGASVVSFGS
jgi:PIN domain nuclease of toxin-antitoxin system